MNWYRSFSVGFRKGFLVIQETTRASRPRPGALMTLLPRQWRSYATDGLVVFT